MDKKYFTVEVRASDPKTEIWLAHPAPVEGYGIVNHPIAHGDGVLIVSVEEADDYVYHFGMKGDVIPLSLHSDVVIIQGVLNVFNMEEV
jgi:hypothetical protein